VPIDTRVWGEVGSISLVIPGLLFPSTDCQLAAVEFFNGYALFLDSSCKREQEHLIPQYLRVRSIPEVSSSLW